MRRRHGTDVPAPAVVGLGCLNHEVVVVADHDFGRDDVGVEEGLGGPLHRGAGEATHVADAACQRVELLVKRRPHGVNGSEVASTG
jgi:hypothetical protein